MKRVIFLLSFLVFFFYGFSQKVIVRASFENKRANAINDTIYYDFSKPLTWVDFKGKPDANHFGGAVTASGFAFDSEMNSDGQTIVLDVKVYTFFVKNDSWKKPNINSDYHLVHEQHHFDITRLSAEKLVKEIANAKFTKSNYNTLLSALFEKAYKENSDLQHQYDKETMHSIDTTKQHEWNDKIAADIQKLKESTVVRN